jgi:hypothetical protein
MPSNRPILSLFDVPGLENLRAVCDEFGVEFTAVGGLVRNLARAPVVRDPTIPGPDLFALAPFASDIDLIHTGDDALTPRILDAIHAEVPAADCFRWQVRSVASNAVYWEATKVNAIVPVNLMSLSTRGRGGLRDPWNGFLDIVDRNYRYVRNGFYRHSPLYRAGRDLEFFSVLLYVRVLLEAGLTPPEFFRQAGIKDAVRVVTDAEDDPRTAVLYGESVYLRARLKYLLKNVFFAAHSSADAYLFLTALRFQGLFERLGINLPWESPPADSPPTAVFAETVSAHLGGDLFRLPESDEPWDVGREAHRALLDALARTRPAQGERTARLGPWQKVLLASPPLPLNPGVSPSSASRGGARHEFVHFAVAVPEQVWSTLGPYDEADVTAVLALDRQEGGETAFFPVAAVCEMRDWTSRRIGAAKSLRLRINCRGLLEHAAQIVGGGWPRLRVFVLGWSGF